MSMPPNPVPDARVPAPSVWAILAGLTALGLLFYVSGSEWLIAALGVALVLPLFVRGRLASDSYLRWMIRVALIALIYQVSQGDETRQNLPMAIGTASLRTLFGELYAAEMVVQAWRKRDAGGLPKHPRGDAVFRAWCILTACNVFDDRLVALITPVYMLFMAFALREWRGRNAAPVAGRTGATARSVRFQTAIQRVAAILATLSLWGLRRLRLSRCQKDAYQRPRRTPPARTSPLLGDNFGMAATTTTWFYFRATRRRRTVF